MTDLRKMRQQRDELLQRIQLIEAELSSARSADPAWRRRALRAHAHLLTHYRHIKQQILRCEETQKKQTDWELIRELCSHLVNAYSGNMPDDIHRTYETACERIGWRQ